MITDSQTNKLYLSDLLLDKKYIQETKKIINIFERHNICYDFLKGTNDIWCRDYMPVQVSEDKYIQFLYEPGYLIGDEHLKSIPDEVCRQNNIKTIKSCLNIDGGNIVKSRDKVILTDRIFNENKNFSKKDIINELEQKLESEVIIIKQIKSEMTGHADGMIRFVDGKTLLVNELKNEYLYIKLNLYKLIRDYSFDYIEVPWFVDKTSKESALGIYINFLEVGNLIVLPVFETKENRDNEAVEVIKKAYPNKIIETININAIGLEGGLMNCITWNIKE